MRDFGVDLRKMIFIEKFNSNLTQGLFYRLAKAQIFVAKRWTLLYRDR